MEALQEYEPYLKNPPTIISGDMNIEVQRYELLAWDKAISDHSNEAQNYCKILRPPRIFGFFSRRVWRGFNTGDTPWIFLQENNRCICLGFKWFGRLGETG